MSKLKVVWSVKSECGPIRKKNEDSVYPEISGSSLVPFRAGVFDGMGGHKKGEVASNIASLVMKEDHKDLKTYVEIENVTGELIPRRINPFTGRGYDPGEIYGYYLANSPNPNLDPSRYRKPRSMEIGIQLIF